MKIFALETGLYKAVNDAVNTRDVSKFRTLGPFAFLLYRILQYPSLKNALDASKFLWRAKSFDRTVKLFRGIEMSNQVLDQYKKLLENKEWFEFNGFVSTNVDKVDACKYPKKVLK